MECVCSSAVVFSVPIKPAKNGTVLVPLMEQEIILKEYWPNPEARKKTMVHMIFDLWASCQILCAKAR